MTLRHIKPRTPEWQDALEEKSVQEEDVSGLAEVRDRDLYKLRQILALEQSLMGMPSPWEAASTAA